VNTGLYIISVVWTRNNTDKIYFLMICPNPEFFTLYHISKYYIATKSKA